MVKSHTAGWPKGAPTAAQLKEFFAQIESGCVTKERLQLFLRGDLSYELARYILGQDFIPPKEIAAARGLTYSGERLRYFADTLPSMETIMWCRANDCMLVAGPPRKMSLLEIRELKPRLFRIERDGWYAKDEFSRRDKVKVDWLILRKGPVPDSTDKMWEEQQKLLSSEERVPNAAEAVWGFTTHREVCGVYVVPDICVRTSSVGSDGNRVLVGRRFDHHGLYVHLLGDDHCLVGLGLSSARLPADKVGK